MLRDPILRDARVVLGERGGCWVTLGAVAFGVQEGMVPVRGAEELLGLGVAWFELAVGLAVDIVGGDALAGGVLRVSTL